ncbi:MAG: DUF1501 domain-containing protein [Pirellulales bacterium]
MHAEDLRRLQRRAFLGRSASGLGAVALAALLDPTLGRSISAAEVNAAGGGGPENAGGSNGVIQPLHLPARAKRVIWLCMAGGPSHLETFDHKPKLAELDGQPMPDSLTKGQPIAQLQGQQLKCFAPQYPFVKHGQSGQEMSSLFPLLGEVADELTIVRSMVTDAINHDPAHTFMNTGSLISGRPSMGAWVTYGLGSAAADLPGFVVLLSTGRGGQNQPIASRQWHSGFLPSRYQGVQLRGQGDPVLYLSNPNGVDRELQRETVQTVQQLNRLLDQSVHDPEIATRISQYELAFQMQASVPELMDLSQEPASVLEMYGTPGADGSYAANCLLARRLAQRGVRFIQLYHRDWDHHGNLKHDIALKAEEVDRPTAALIRDLKSLGMLDDTLIVWGGEFGRTPMSQGGSGRDHHMKAFSMFLAGGGIRGGMTWGATDELGYNSVENVVTVHDLHHTMLHLLGIDADRFSVKFQGLDARLTGVEPSRVVTEILA